MPFTYSVAEYADMIYVYSICDSNSVHAIAEYQQRFPNCRIPTRGVFTQIYQSLWDTGTLPGISTAAECDVNEGVIEEEDIVQMVQSSPGVSMWRIARHLCVPHTRVWRTLHAECIYPYHVQWVQHLRPGSFAERLEFCKWLNATHELYHYFLFTDEAQFNFDIVIIHTTFMCGQMRITTPPWNAFFNYVLVSMCGVQFWTISWLVLSSWKFVRGIPQFSAGGITLTFGGCAFDFWINEVVCISNMTAPPHSSRQVSNFLNYRFPGRWMGRGVPHNWPASSPDLSPLDYCVWDGWENWFTVWRW